MGCCSYIYVKSSGSNAALRAPLKSIAHNEKMSTKQKASLNGNGTARGNVGQPLKRYHLNDVVKLVRFWSRMALLKIDIVMCNLEDTTSSFADLDI